MESALLSLVGILLGVLLSEYFYRKKRIEPYAHQLFEKRLVAHESLLNLCNAAYSAIGDVLKDVSPAEERHAVVSKHILEIADHCDSNMLYLNEDLTGHVFVTFVGVDEIPDIEDEQEREAAEAKFRENYRSAKEMIIAESGAAEINKHFSTVAKSVLSSDIIEYMRELRKNRV